MTLFPTAAIDLERDKALQFEYKKPAVEHTLIIKIIEYACIAFMVPMVL